MLANNRFSQTFHTLIFFRFSRDTGLAFWKFKKLSNLSLRKPITNSHWLWNLYYLLATVPVIPDHYFFQEEERIAAEKAELRREVDNEIKTLQQNLTKLQQVQNVNILYSRYTMSKSYTAGTKCQNLTQQIHNVKILQNYSSYKMSKSYKFTAG